MDHITKATEAALAKGVESTSVELPKGQQSNQDAVQALKDAIDLDSVEKIKLDGKEWTLKELKESILRQKDYTKKTQELANERKYVENLQFDLDALADNPQLLDEFKKIYPEKYHATAEKLVSRIAKRDQVKEEKTQEKQSEQNDGSKEMMSRLQRLESFIAEKEAQAMDMQLTEKFSKFEQQFPHADADVVLSKAIALREKTGQEITDEVWTKLWKMTDEKAKQRIESIQKKKVETTKQKHQEALDVLGGPSGSIGQTPQKQNFENAYSSMMKQVLGKG